MDGNGSLFGTLCGNNREILHKVSVDLPKKHGRGGQSALRFARLRMEKRHNYVRKIAELAVQVCVCCVCVVWCGVVGWGGVGGEGRRKIAELAVQVCVWWWCWGKGRCGWVGVCVGGREVRLGRMSSSVSGGSCHGLLGDRSDRMLNRCPRPPLPSPLQPPPVLHHQRPAQRGGPGDGGVGRLQDRAQPVRHV